MVSFSWLIDFPARIPFDGGILAGGAIMKTLWLVIGLSICLAGCVTPDQQRSALRGAAQQPAAPVLLGTGF